MRENNPTCKRIIPPTSINEEYHRYDFVRLSYDCLTLIEEMTFYMNFTAWKIKLSSHLTLCSSLFADFHR